MESSIGRNRTHIKRLKDWRISCTNRSMANTLVHLTRSAALVVLTLICFRPAQGQARSEETPPPRILGILPNYRTAAESQQYTPIMPKEKFRLAGEDAFDRGTFILSGLFAAQAQLTNSDPTFRHGPKSVGRYYAASYADFAIGDYITEGIFPTLLHQDPRYFPRNNGGAWSRARSALLQIVWTRTDSGRKQFNFSETVGNATAVAISNAYYPGNRNVTDAVTKLGMQIGVDAAANVIKEFSPELTRLFSRKHRDERVSK